MSTSEEALEKEAGQGEGKPDGRRERILKAAIEVFASKGFHNALMDEVARAAGVGKGTIYLYVSDKEHLLLEAIRHQLAMHDERVRALVEQTPDPIAVLYELAHLDFEFFTRNVELGKVVQSEQAALGYSKRFQETMTQMRRERLELLLSVIVRAQREQKLRNDVPAEDLATVYSGIVGSYFFSFLFDGGAPSDTDAVAARCVDLFLQGAGVKGAAS